MSSAIVSLLEGMPNWYQILEQAIVEMPIPQSSSPPPIPPTTTSNVSNAVTDVSTTSTVAEKFKSTLNPYAKSFSFIRGKFAAKGAAYKHAKNECLAKNPNASEQEILNAVTFFFYNETKFWYERKQRFSFPTKKETIEERNARFRACYGAAITWLIYVRDCIEDVIKLWKKLDPEWTLSKWARKTGVQTYGTDVIGVTKIEAIYGKKKKTRYARPYGQDLWNIFNNFVNELLNALEKDKILVGKDTGLDSFQLYGLLDFMGHFCGYLLRKDATIDSLRQYFYTDEESLEHHLKLLASARASASASASNI